MSLQELHIKLNSAMNRLKACPVDSDQFIELQIECEELQTIIHSLSNPLNFKF